MASLEQLELEYKESRKAVNDRRKDISEQRKQCGIESGEHYDLSKRLTPLNKIQAEMSETIREMHKTGMTYRRKYRRELTYTHPEFGEDTNIEQVNRMKNLMHAIMEVGLTERQREIFLMKVVDLKKISEIAEIFGIKEITVYSHLKLIEKKIKKFQSICKI